MFFIHSHVHKLFIDFMGFRIDQANFSTNTMGKVQVSTEYCNLVFGGGLGFLVFFLILS